MRSTEDIVKAIMQRQVERLRNINYKKIMALQTHPDTQPYNREKQYRFIGDLYNSLSGKEIWIIGCGPSLDNFPNNFFDGKLTIALNWSIMEFPNSTYWRADAQALLFMRDYQPGVFRRTFIGFPFALHIPGPSEKALEKILGKYYFDPIRFKWVGSQGKLSLFKKNAANAISAALVPKSSFVITYIGTSLHIAVLIAVYLGAKRITLTGYSGFKKFCPHAQRGLLKDFYRVENRKRPFKDMRSGTECLVHLLGRHGIKMKKYLYNKGYVDI